MDDKNLDADPDSNLILFAAAILIGIAGSGHTLKRQVKRDAAASENEN